MSAAGLQYAEATKELATATRLKEDTNNLITQNETVGPELTKERFQVKTKEAEQLVFAQKVETQSKQINNNIWNMALNCSGKVLQIGTLGLSSYFFPPAGFFLKPIALAQLGSLATCLTKATT